MPEHERAAYSEAQADAIWVGERPKLNSTVTLAEYDPEWPRLFEREAVRIRGILGEQALVLEHVGSTSVPGLCAKPIIDILLVVPDSADEDRYVPQLEAAGYRLVIREPDWEQHRAFKGPDTDINLHVIRRAVVKSSATGCSVTDCAHIPANWTSTRRPSGSSPTAPGRISRTTPTPRTTWSTRSSRGLRPGKVLDQAGDLSADRP